MPEALASAGGAERCRGLHRRVTGPSQSKYLYGVSVNNRLYSINIATQKEQQLSLFVDPTAKLANGVALDPYWFNLFVMDGNNNLRI